MSTIKANKLEHISTSNGGIQLDNAGHVTVDGQQMPTAGPLSNRNLIINGAMSVAQRGTSSTSGGYCSVDRIKGVTSDTNTQSQESLSTSDTPYSYGFRNYYRLKNTTASDGGASTYREIDYRVEARDIASSGWDYTSTSSYITIQFWLRASITQSYYLHIRSEDGTQRSFVSELAVNAGTWKKFEITIPGNSGITLNNDVGLGLLVRFIPWYGTGYTGSGTLDAWTASSNEIIPDMTDTWGETADATFDITGLQLEVGEKATPFEHRSFGDELARCLRYFEKSYNYGTAPGTVTDTGMIGLRKSSATSAIYDINLFYAHKRTTPTIVLYSPGSGASGKAEVDTTDQTAQGSDIGENNTRVTGTSQGDAVYIRVQYTADAEL